MKSRARGGDSGDGGDGGNGEGDDGDGEEGEGGGGGGGGGGGALVRMPQSWQSVPRPHQLYSAPGPPSSHSSSLDHRQSSAQSFSEAAIGGSGGGAGGRGNGGDRGGAGGKGGGTFVGIAPSPFVQRQYSTSSSCIHNRSRMYSETESSQFQLLWRQRRPPIQAYRKRPLLEYRPEARVAANTCSLAPWELILASELPMSLHSWSADVHVFNSG